MASEFASILVFLCVVNSGLLKEIPDYIHVCKRDPNTIEECAIQSVEALRPKLKTGIPELNVPSLEPFFIAEIKPSADMPISASAQNIRVTGASDFVIKSLSVDLDTFKFRVRIQFPKLHFEGEYKVDAQLLVVPLKGQGTLSADAVKCDAEIVVHSKIIQRDGEEYLKFKKIESNINIKDYKVQLEGLFNGDKALGEAANQAINQNRGEFLKALKPPMERGVSRIIKEAANNIVDGLPLKQLLPLP